MKHFIMYLYIIIKQTNKQLLVCAEKEEKKRDLECFSQIETSRKFNSDCLEHRNEHS